MGPDNEGTALHMAEFDELQIDSQSALDRPLHLTMFSDRRAQRMKEHNCR